MRLPTDVSTRRAGPADAEALSELHLDCWDDAYTGLVPQEILAERRMRIPERIDYWRGALERGEVVWVAERDGTFIGFSEAQPADDPEHAGLLELRVLYVRAQWWGTTVGHHLFRRAVGDEPSYLCVLEGIHPGDPVLRASGLPDGRVHRGRAGGQARPDAPTVSGSLRNA